MVPLPESLAGAVLAAVSHSTRFFGNLTSSDCNSRLCLKDCFNLCICWLFSELLCWCSAPRSLPELGKGIGEGIRGFKAAIKVEEEKPNSATANIPADQGPPKG